MSYDKIESIGGVHHLKKLEELELNKYKSMASNLAGCRLNTCARSYLVNNTADSYSNWAIDWLGGELY